MNNEYDCGAILKQEKIPIYDTDTSKELKDRTVLKSRALITEFLNDLNEKILTPVNQDEKKATYFPNITGEEMMLDFEIQNSNEISRTIRALHPFLPTYITYKDVFFIVDPYNFKIIDKTVDMPPNSIINKNSDKKSITIVCYDNKPIQFNNLRLYKKSGVKKYIKNQVDVIKWI